MRLQPFYGKITSCVSFVLQYLSIRDGCTALLAVSHQVGLIFVEKEERFISIVIDEVPASDGAFTGLPDDTAFLEAVCDCFVF